jgi:hypothetical protein
MPGNQNNGGRSSYGSYDTEQVNARLNDSNGVRPAGPGSDPYAPYGAVAGGKSGCKVGSCGTQSYHASNSRMPLSLGESMGANGSNAPDQAHTSQHNMNMRAPRVHFQSSIRPQYNPGNNVPDALPAVQQGSVAACKQGGVVGVDSFCMCPGSSNQPPFQTFVPDNLLGVSSEASAHYDWQGPWMGQERGAAKGDKNSSYAHRNNVNSYITQLHKPSFAFSSGNA